MILKQMAKNMTSPHQRVVHERNIVRKRVRWERIRRDKEIHKEMGNMWR